MQSYLRNFLIFSIICFFLYPQVVISRGAGECAMLCNDLRFEVLTLEICR
jgi:hypothetical protein